MIYKAVQFIVSEECKLNIIFNSEGNGFHYTDFAPNNIIKGSVLVIKILSEKLAYDHYNLIHDISDVTYYGLEALGDITSYGSESE